VILYVCPSDTSFLHPCYRARQALEETGHSFETRRVRGGIAKFWTWPSRATDRAEVQRLSGQRGVPILVLDDGEVITGSRDIIEWARTLG
jgi:glutathione S-transferase